MRKAGTFLTHVAAALLFISVAGLWTFHARDKGPEDIRTSDTTGVFYSAVINAREVREQQSQTRSLPDSVQRGLVSAWHSNELPALYQRLFEAYVASVYRATGDVMDAYKILVFPLNLVFLTGAYLVFLRVTARPAMSAWLAVIASMPVFLPLAGEQFGMGPVTLFSRRHLLTAFAPLVVWTYFRYQDDTRGMLITFGLAGLISNLHASGILLIEILAVTSLLRRDLDGKQIGVIALGLLIALVTGGIAVGGLWGQIGASLKWLLTSMVASAYASVGSHKVISEDLTYVFYPPHILSHLPGWLVHLVSGGVAAITMALFLFRGRLTSSAYSLLLFCTVTGIVAFLAFSEFKYWLVLAIGLFAVGRRRPSDRVFELVHLCVIAAYIVSFFGMLSFQAAYYLFEDAPLVFNQLRGVRFIGFFVFVWISVLLRDASWKAAPSALRLFVTGAAVVAVFADVRVMIRDNFRQPSQHLRNENFMAAARWARTNTEVRARFMVDSWAFGITAEREVHIGDKSASKHGFMRANHQERVGLARAYKTDYVVLEKRDSHPFPSNMKLEYENEHFAIAKVSK